MAVFIYAGRVPRLKTEAMSYFKTALLLGVLTAIFVAVGYLLGGQMGMLIAFGVALAMNLFAYWNADKMVLRMYNAQEVDRRSAPEFYGIVEDLANRAQLPMPRVYVIDEAQPNAFATGRDPNHAAVAATRLGVGRFIGYDIDETYLTVACAQVGAAMRRQAE